MTFPPLIPLMLAVAVMNIPYPNWIGGVFSRLGGTLAPLAPVSVGLQLRLDALPGIKLPLALGLSFKLLAGPAILILIYCGALGWTASSMRITLFASAMRPQIGAAIVATQYGLNPPLVTMMVGVGTLMAFATAPAWWHVLAVL